MTTAQKHGKHPLDRIPINSSLSYLAVDIANKFEPFLERQQLTPCDLALAIQQGIDRSAAPDLLAACEAGAAYSNALQTLQKSGLMGTFLEGRDELDRLFADWHDKTHAAIAKAKSP